MFNIFGKKKKKSSVADVNKTIFIKETVRRDAPVEDITAAGAAEEADALSTILHEEDKELLDVAEANSNEDKDITDDSENILSDGIESSETDINISDDIEINKKGDIKKNKKNKKSNKNGNFFKRFFGLEILDRYILRKFLGTYFLATLLFLAVIAMFDITEKLDAFLTAPLKETLFDYFASFLPYFANQLSPLFVFISVIFFTTKLADNSEIIAMLSSGISFRRLLRPYMIGAAVIALLTFALSNYLIPPTNVKRIEYTNKYVKNKEVKSGVDIQMIVKPGVVAYIGRFDGPSKTGYRFSLDKFEGKQLVSRMTAQRIVYDTTTNYKWTASEYMIRTFSGTKEKIVNGASLDTIIPIEPKDILISVNDQETLTTPQLTTYIEKQRNRGVANITAFEIERERRYAATAAAFILTLIGMSLSSKKVKGGMGINIGIGLALSFSYILFSTVTSSFAISGLTSPFIAMEIPNAVYLLIAIILYKRASRR